MTLRKMSNAFRGFEFYSSTFDTDTGTLVREFEVPTSNRGSWELPHLVLSVAKPLGIRKRTDKYDELDLEWATKYSSVYTYEGAPRPYARSNDLRDGHAFSPVPETIDVKITNWCNGPDGLCNYCYMDSNTKGRHAPRGLLTQIFDGLDEAPYQIAFGGGEPTAHPDFPWFLEYTREKGTVPNYTSAGHILRDDVFDATNKYCGGVALTYHSFVGPEKFKKTYDTWRSRLDKHIQLNVHVIFDNNVADSLYDLRDAGLRDLNIVLLAYYPEIGRSGWSQIPSKGVYERALPLALAEVTKAGGFKIAFSEGLLPYFLSHKLEQVDTTFATQQEGCFSCYVDDQGFVSSSSFNPPDTKDEKGSIYNRRFQEIWNRLEDFRRNHFDRCSNCEYSDSCHIPHEAHFLLCKFADHNRTAPTKIPSRKRKLEVL